MDCGPTCLQMIAKFYGRNFTLPFLREISHLSKDGVSLQGIMEAADQIGFRTIPVKVPFDKEKKGEPTQGKFKLDHDTFKKNGVNDKDKGYALILESCTLLSGQYCCSNDLSNCVPY